MQKILSAIRAVGGDSPFIIIWQWTKFLAVTAAFTAFCALVGLILWYSLKSLDNGFYEVIACFLAIIAAANVMSRYVVWSINLHE